MSDSALQQVLGPERPEGMTPRERFRAVVRFEPVDRLPFWEPLGFAPDTLAHWVANGFPPDTSPEVFFDLERVELAPIHLGALPEVEPGMLPVTTHDQFERVQRHYSCYSPARYPTWWEDDKRAWAQRRYPLGLAAIGPLGWLREWCGGEACRVLSEQPGLARALMTFGVEFCICTLERAGREVEADFALVKDRWGLAEGLAVDEGVVASLAPLYERLAEGLRGFGIETVVLCSDGDVTPLARRLLDAGVNGIMPCSARDGVDVMALAKAHPRDLILVGGLDARVLARDRRDADREARLKIPTAMKRGGWLPCFDSRIGPEAKFDNYRAYWEAALEIAAGEWPPDADGSGRGAEGQE